MAALGGGHTSRMHACRVGWLVAALALSVQLLCEGAAAPAASRTAFVVPSMQQDNPGNHSYRRFGSIVMNREMLKAYDTVMLTSDYRIVPSLFSDEPVRLSRNLTVTSANYSSEGYKLLELDFAVQRVLIPEGMRLTFKDLALGRARQTPGQGVPFVVGEGPRSVLVLDNVVRIRTACAHNEPELVNSLSSISRSDPGAVNASSSNSSERVKILPSYLFRGKPYYDNILAVDARYFVGPVDVPDSNYYAGYTMWQLNTTRICETYVSDECVWKKGPEACVEEQIALLINLKPNEAAAAPNNQSSGVNVAAVVAPSVAGGALLVAGVAVGVFLLLRRRRHRHAEAGSKSSLLPVSAKGGFPTGHPQAGGGMPDVPCTPASPPLLPMGPFSGAAGSIEQLAVGTRAGSWQMLAFHAAPEFDDATPYDKVALGVLLGAGSYGRVYQGVWRKRDVAVKVLQHDGSTAAAISNEVNLVLSFRHPNIIAAYYFVTWARTRDGPAPDTRSLDQLADGSDNTANTGTFSLVPCQQVPSGSAARRGPLEPLAEAPSSGDTHHSSPAVPASIRVARSSGSRASSSANTSTSITLRVSLGGRNAQQLGAAASGGVQFVPDPGALSLTAAGGAKAWSSAQGTLSAGSSYGSHVAHSAGSSSSTNLITGSTLGGTTLQPFLPQALAGSSISSTHMQAAAAGLCSAGDVQPIEAADEPQPAQHIPQQHVLPHSSPSPDSGAAQAPCSSRVVPSAAVQLFPFTTGLAASCVQPRQLQQRPHYLRTASDGAAYEVSGPGSSLSASDARNAAPCSSSAGGGTSASLIQAAYGGGSHQQQQPQQHLHWRVTGPQQEQQQLLLKEVITAQQQQQQQQQQQCVQQQLPQRFVPLPPQRSPSPPGQHASSSLSQSQSQSRSLTQPRPGWLADGCSSSMTPSGSKVQSKERSASDEACTWLITELCDGGTLLDLLAPDGQLAASDLAGPRRMGQVLTLLLDVAAGMSYLHSRNVLHGDLKPGNVLIKHVQGAPYGRLAKVSDFGLSRALQTGQSHRSTRTFGTLNHASPELLRLGRLSPAGDIWAFAVLMWECFTGQVAFQGLHYGELFEQVALLQRRPEIPPDMPADYAELMQQCWASDPLSRPPFRTVMQRLEEMLSHLMQDDTEAQARFVSDL